MILAILISAVSAWCFLRALLPYFRQILLDEPNRRSSHHRPTPRGGGVAFVIVPSLATSLALLCSSGTFTVSLSLVVAPLVALPLAFVGLMDDRYNLSPWIRYYVQLATAIVVTLLSPLLTSSIGILVPVLLVISVTAVINFTNFMDGLDGLVGGCMAVAIASLSVS